MTNLQSQAVNPAEDAGVLEGDVILSLNGEKISSKKQLTQIVSACSGQPISMVIRRGDELEQLTVSPVKSSLDNDYHLGLWVRDSSAGIGTMTFYDPQNGCFAGLGHAICDVDTGQIMPLSQGEIVEASIIGVDPGSSGDPGQLQGAFVAQKASGLLYANSYNGVYGQLFDAPAYAQTIPMAQSQEVTEGPAQILTTISGETPPISTPISRRFRSPRRSRPKTWSSASPTRICWKSPAASCRGCPAAPSFRMGCWWGR